MAGLRSELAGCRSTLSLSKIKVMISETKYPSFYKTLVPIVSYHVDMYQSYRIIVLIEMEHVPYHDYIIALIEMESFSLLFEFTLFSRGNNLLETLIFLVFFHIYSAISAHFDCFKGLKWTQTSTSNWNCFFETQSITLLKTIKVLMI